MLVEVKFRALSPVTAKKPLTRDRKPPVNMRFCVGVFPGKKKVYFKISHLSICSAMILNQFATSVQKCMSVNNVFLQYDNLINTP